MSNFTPFVDQTAARLAPDRAERWLAYWDRFSVAIPDEMPEAQYSQIALDAWLQFRKQDEENEVARLATAWGIKKFAKLPQRPRKENRPQPTATVVPPTRWEPCEHWGGTRLCSEHEHAPLSSVARLAQDMWSRFQPFVRKYLGVAIMGYTGGKWYEKFEDVEAEVWFTVMAKMLTYRSLLNEKGEECPQAWLRSIAYSVAASHFRSEHAQRRDVRREVPFFEDVEDRGIPNRDEPPPG